MKILAAIKSGAIDKKLARFFLPLNIMEAVFVDSLAGNKDNAFAGFILAKNPPGVNENKALGSGPTVLSSDGKKALIAPPFPKEYADLYSAWNLAFVSNVGTFWLMKLLIPSVSGYQENPREYMFYRVLGLYTALNMAVILQEQEDQDLIFGAFHPAEFKTFLGKSNAKNARLYQDKINAA
jgi:hypothetical protein